MKFTFSSITKNLQSSLVDGIALYGGVKGYQSLNLLVSRLTSGQFDTPSMKPVKNIAVAVGVAAVADMVVSRRVAQWVGAAAMEQVIAGFLDPTVDPLLISVLLPAGTPSATGGYARMGGYARRGMGGYSTLRGSLFPSVNVAGLPG